SVSPTWPGAAVAGRVVLAVRAVLADLPCDLVQQVRGILQLQEQLHPREVHASHLREVADHPHAPQIIVGVEADVRFRPYGLEQPLLLVDPQRARMAPGEARGDRDDVHRPTATYHGTFHIS